ncbi:MAG: 50S ribosomal protein L15 [Sphingobacteriia bacterium]|jgi:large subunit ribosomal protein L15|nr:50S ribosomal protein L15 [Sphingobacteriia bacterium]
MKLHTLAPVEGYGKTRKRVGRGQGSGRGGTSTKGNKGQRSRSGYNYRSWFEGGQMPLQRRLPKFGFNNIFRVEYSPVNLDVLQALIEANPQVTEIDPEMLKSKGILSGRLVKVKILGRGEINKAITVKAHRFSESAKAAITAAGGSIIEIER